MPVDPLLPIHPGDAEIRGALYDTHGRLPIARADAGLPTPNLAGWGHPAEITRDFPDEPQSDVNGNPLTVIWWKIQLGGRP